MKMLNKSQYICLLILSFLVLSPEAWAKYPPKLSPNAKVASKDINFTYRADCAPSRSEADMSINNVRARLLGGGDVWWDLTEGKYIVPKVDPASGLPEVSSLFAGAVWLGGYDPVGNLKLAAQTFRNANANDFWPGPLDPITGTIERDTCAMWDRHFRVLGDNIRKFLRDYNLALEAGTVLDIEDIPEDVLGWPARGNPYFSDIHGFDLPNTSQGLAGFWDNNGDFAYDPLQGDYPIIEVRGCPLPQYPDEMIFWIYNDAGGIHTQTQGNAIQMEVQVQAFAYATNDEVNDMTFQRYKLINRATQSIDSTFFAMWVDPDLGCANDDYIGCDTARSLAYVYNEDRVDGITGCDCEGTSTYCEDVPMLGVDYFRGPLNEQGEEIGMSSFTYYNNAGVGQWPNAQTDPDIAQEYYNYMSGSWKDGTPFSYGGDAFNVGSPRIDYAFTESPDDPTGWSMCTANLAFGDRRTIQASGPFRLDPGAVNELIIGVVWVPDIIDYPCPSIDPLIFADETAQALFDNCFDITDGPDAPDMDFIELDQELICILSNDRESNNYQQEYQELDLRAPTDLPEEDKIYLFEGYKVFQMDGPEVTTAELDNPDKARLIFQVDIKNEISQIVNWNAIPHPTERGKLLYEPEIKVVGADQGIRQTFRITEDQFAKGDRTLINHKKYYFTVIAYAHNNFDPFDTQNNTGQRIPYLEGRRNIKTYIPIPRPISYQKLNTKYGDGPAITRLDGIGAGNQFLDITQETESSILDGSFDGRIDYKNGMGPIDVIIFNPLDVVEGEFILSFRDGNMDDDILESDARWTLKSVSDPSLNIVSETTLDQLNEQVVGQFGFSISIGQTNETGDLSEESNGALGTSIEYEDPNNPWLSFISDESGTVFDFVKTNVDEADFKNDPNQSLSTSFNGLVPFYLADFRFDPNGNLLISPGWVDATAGMQIVRTRTSLANLNNVDIVLTPDKSKWSRCVVIETATPYYFNPGNAGGADLNTIGGSKNFDLRNSPSVGKDDADGDGKPDPDGDGMGMGWFPGYAIDVESGQRLNVFFGENSVYNDAFFENINQENAIGADMMWNPDNRIGLDLAVPNISVLHTAGQHFIYVTNQPYDGCIELRDRLDPGAIFVRKFNALSDVTWTGIPFTTGNLKSYQEGLIPNPVKIKLRVSNPYQVSSGTNENRGYPSYQFKIEGQASEDLIAVNEPGILDAVNVAPNPYLAYSSYETSQFTTTIKITNLPPRCVVTIYSLEGKLIRQYKRDESRIPIASRTNPGILSNQVVPDLEWDLKNSKGIPIASGLYLIHINGYELGERTIKWFGVNRKFDPSGL